MIIKNKHSLNDSTEITLDLDDNIIQIKTGIDGRDLTKAKDIHEMIAKIQTLFEFTGVGRLHSNNYCLNYRESDKLKQLIYKLKLEFPIRFVEINKCKCNPYCPAVISVLIRRICETYGDVLHQLGLEYPLPYMVGIAPVSIPSEIHIGKLCYETIIPYAITEEDGMNYLEWHIFKI